MTDTVVNETQIALWARQWGWERHEDSADWSNYEWKDIIDDREYVSEDMKVEFVGKFVTSAGKLGYICNPHIGKWIAQNIVKKHQGV